MVVIGIVGKPNVGKSTLFSALTSISVEISNRPFTTIEPNEGFGYVRVRDPGLEMGLKPNPRRGFLLGKYRFVPVKLLDVAGLVPGAHKGKGLGNKFLDDLRKADGIILVVDCSGSTDEEGNYVGPGKYNPLKDVEWLKEELIYWILGILERNWDKMVKRSRDPKVSLEDEIVRLFSGLQINKDIILDGIKEIGEPESWGREEKLRFSRVVVERGKPIVIAANKVDVEGSERNLKRLMERYENVVPVSAYAELILKRLSAEGKIEYIPGESEFKIKGNIDGREKKALEFIEERILKVYGSTGVQQVLEKLVFEVLGYVAVFPVASQKMTDKEGNILPDCFLMPKGSTVLDLARKIHSDIAERFVKAINVKENRIVGKEYMLKDGDIIQILLH